MHNTSNHSHQQTAAQSSATSGYYGAYGQTAAGATGQAATDTASASAYYQHPQNGYDYYAHGSHYTQQSYYSDPSATADGAAYAKDWQQSGYNGYSQTSNYNTHGGYDNNSYYGHGTHQANYNYDYYGQNGQNYYNGQTYNYSASGYNTGMNYGSHNDNTAVAANGAAHTYTKESAGTANGHGYDSGNNTANSRMAAKSYGAFNKPAGNGVVASASATHLYANGTSKHQNDEAPAYIAVKPTALQSKVLAKNVFEEEAVVDTNETSENMKETTAKSSMEYDCPPDLKDYISRAFDACPKDKHNALHKHINGIICKAHSHDRVNGINWATRPLPPMCSMLSAKKEAKRKKKALLLQQQEKKESHIIGEDWKREKRARRFQSDAPNAADIRQDIRRYTEVQAKDVIDWDEYTIVGTSQKLEKRYLRLTSAPDPTTVRPLPVLEKSLAFIRQKWEEKASYAYLCDQLKAVRQDLTVQRIKNEFTVSVYQVHARLALEHGDLGEYNQCQTQLRQLYEYQIVGNEMEFVAYRILYMLHTRNSADIIATLATLSAKQKADPAVRHALDVRSAISMSNYHRLFRLYAEAPNHGRYLMDQFVGRERLNALTIICRAYLPHIDVLYVQKELGFSKLEDFTTFLCEHDLQSCLDIPNHRLDTRKASVEVAICMKKFEKIDIKGQV